MVHWSEGHRRENPGDDFPPRDARDIGVRAFVAIRMNEQVETSIAATIEELRRPRDGVRWVPRANLHITLKFLGANVDAHRLERLSHGLHELAARTAPFDVEARGIGGFPDLKSPRAIWVGLHSVELGAFAARVENVAAECGFPRENRRWSGHLTIGRVRERLTAKTRDAIRQVSAMDPEFGTSRIESIMLYRSHLGGEASRYEALATFLFARRG